jgi:hypothetical protein
MNNPTAFPQCAYNMKGGYDITGGMTLRDYFAAKAMQKMIWNLSEDEKNAKDCYEIADAMLKAREA